MLADLPKAGFNPIIRQEFADSESILRQDGDDLFHWDDFYILLCAKVFAPDKVALVSNSCLSAVFPGKEINLENTWMKARDLCQIHTKFPNQLQGGINQHRLF